MLKPRLLNEPNKFNDTNKILGISFINNEEAYDENSRKVYLLSRGRIFLNTSYPLYVGEPLSIILNYPVRGKVNKFILKLFLKILKINLMFFLFFFDFKDMEFPTYMRQ
jgi:hypothetical protein